MHKRFRCGLVTLTKNGKVKKLGLDNGGGSRWCDWFNKSMTLKDVHRLIRNIFKLEADTECETSLYDFKLQPLDFNQYRTFFEYIRKQGLNRAIFDFAASNNNPVRKSLLANEKKAKKKKSNTAISREETSVQTITSSSTTSIEFMHVEDEQDFDRQQIANSSYDYSLINSIREDVHDLLSQNDYDLVLISLFENTSLIHEYSCLIIDALKQRIGLSKTDFQAIKQADITFHSNCLNNTYNICELTLELLQRETHKFSHIQLYSMICESFTSFFLNLQIIRTQWFNRVENYNDANLVSSSLVKLEASSVSQCDLDKTIEISRQDHRENVNLFQQLLEYARDLLSAMHGPSLSTFYDMIQSIIVDIESIQSTISMCDPKSISSAKQMMISVKFRYTKKFDSKAFASSIYQITRSAKQAYQKTLRAICDLLSYLTNYQIQSVRRKLENTDADNHDQIKIVSVKSESLPHHVGIGNKSN
ncbi:unnamed protein product [Rotaria magnacalcarata]|uniref:Uncharacterized protein n=1 Tax=Rotaria magnacalcarata TaxID=392030 RepID=A0A819LVW1_9BILA|nr:unnamed protein product [Rotaria magnacalcarata]